MQISRVAFAGALAMLLPGQASAALRGDFPGPAICSKLNAMPKGYKAHGCNKRTPLRGECRFTLPGNGIPIEYLIDNGLVLDKTVTLGSSASIAAPFGLRRGDGYDSAARKIRDSAGLASQQWTDSDDEAVSYLQSDAVSCGRSMSYTIYVWFRNGGAESVSVSTLPVV